MGGQEYHTIIVTFDQEGGGVDHDDEYRYWIHKANHTLDYFAYNYQVNEGGTRFRSVVDWKIIDSVRYQNYINWMPEKKFEPLDNLPGLFDSGALKEVSRIINEDIESLR